VIGLRYTLLSDGSSDKALMPILTWLLRSQGVSSPVQSEWADLRRLPAPPRALTDRILRAVDLFPCDLLFVHRDAEREPHTSRVDEIEAALATAGLTLPAAPVVPVRMQEAWLLIDEQAIRTAAGNPNGRQPLALPALDELENLPDAKDRLYTLLREASGLHGRRLQAAPIRHFAQRVTTVSNDFAPLRSLPAFAELEARVAGLVHAHRWAK
jgi:hypothetical protein